jgi:hypothetical protein
MGRAAAERMASKVVLCRPCRENNHSECLKRYERCDCSLCVCCVLPVWKMTQRNTTGLRT